MNFSVSESLLEFKIILYSIVWFHIDPRFLENKEMFVNKAWTGIGQPFFINQFFKREKKEVPSDD